MERYKLNGDRAFGPLVRVSQSTHRQLSRDELVRSGELSGQQR
jgi:hypothetical protein